MIRPQAFIATTLLVITACGGDRVSATEITNVAQELEPEGPFKGLGLRFDGYYREERGGLVYLVRFFAEGRAVLINGTKDYEPQLPPLLTRDTKGDPAIGHYNVGVRVDCDSLFFTTRPERGEIDYAGVVVDGSTVRFRRYSHITGDVQEKTYLFQPDGATLPADPETGAQGSQ